MPVLVGPGLVAAALVALAGAQKVIDPSMTVGALRAMHLPGRPGLVRLGAAVELALGIAAIAVGGRIVWCLLAASYTAFAVFVAAALRAGTPIGSCGCFGRADTAPRARHIALDVGLAAAAALAAARASTAPFDELRAHPGSGAVVAALAAVALAGTYAAFTRPGVAP